MTTTPDAIYFPDEDTLIFRNLATVSSIFKGIDQLYKKATKQEVKSFLKEKFIDLQNDYSEKKVSKPNRKRIALAMNSLKNMSSADRNNIFKYIHKYCSTHLQIDKNKKTIQISNDNDLKLMLYGIEQRFFTTPIGKEKRLANSIQKL